jgi:hypothetical protein
LQIQSLIEAIPYSVCTYITDAVTFGYISRTQSNKVMTDLIRSFQYDLCNLRARLLPNGGRQVTSVITSEPTLFEYLDFFAGDGVPPQRVHNPHWIAGTTIQSELLAASTVVHPRGFLSFPPVGHIRYHLKVSFTIAGFAV